MTYARCLLLLLLISSFSVLDPKLFKLDISYGYDIEMLSSHYKLNTLTCKEEWLAYKQMHQDAMLEVTMVVASSMCAWAEGSSTQCHSGPETGTRAPGWN